MVLGFSSVYSSSTSKISILPSAILKISNEPPYLKILNLTPLQNLRISHLVSFYFIVVNILNLFFYKISKFVSIHSNFCKNSFYIFNFAILFLSSFGFCDESFVSAQNTHENTEFFINGEKWNFTPSLSWKNLKFFGTKNSTIDIWDNASHLRHTAQPTRLGPEEKDACSDLNRTYATEHAQKVLAKSERKSRNNYIRKDFVPYSLETNFSQYENKKQAILERHEQRYLNGTRDDIVKEIPPLKSHNKTINQTTSFTTKIREITKTEDKKLTKQKKSANTNIKERLLNKDYHDYCIIGAGPAGLQMGYFMKKASRDYIIYERANISGSFFTVYPRHRKMISINKRFTGNTNSEFQLRHDWNSLLSDRDSLLFKRFSGDFFPQADSVVSYLNEYQRKLNINVRYNTDIRNIRRIPKSIDRSSVFKMNDQNDSTFSCRYVIVATGLWEPNNPIFEGSDMVQGYEDFDLDTQKYEDKNVLILGRGNAAFETAESLYGHTNFVHMISRSRARLAWNTHYVGDLRAINNGLLDTYQLKSLDGLLEAAVEDMTLERRGKKLYVNFPVEDKSKMDLKVLGANAPNRTVSAKQNLSGKGASKSSVKNLRNKDKMADNFSLREGYDFVIRCLGFTFDHSLFHNSTQFSRFGKEGKYPGIKDTYESRIIPDLYVAGTIAHSLDYRKSSGGFIHGFRYTVRVLHRLLEWKNHGVRWPITSHIMSDFLNVIVRRINEASGPYQMFETLADIIFLNEEENVIDLLEEFPIALLPRLESLTGRTLGRSRIIVLLMEYGPDFSGPDKDTFRLDRATGDPLEAHRSNFLHPVLYYYDKLPTESDMLVRWGKLLLPKPKRIHHVLEDFLTLWTAQKSHILPLRRFLETITSEDLRHRFACSCFHLSLTHSKLPLKCRKTPNSGEKLIYLPRTNVS